MQARRDKLKGISALSGSTHAGLWLDRFLPEQEVRGAGGEKGSKAEFFRQVAQLGEAEGYAEFFAQRRRAVAQLQAQGLEVEWVTWKVNGRLTTGLGAANVLENGFALHHTYGVPYLPASGLKGLASKIARTRMGEGWQKTASQNLETPGHEANSRWYRMTFGDESEAGGVEFFDALIVPFQQARWQLVADVLTPHHRDYYSNTPNSPPADWDSPVPISFLAVEGCFEAALVGPLGWPTLTRQILEEGLRTEGFGAKTSSGFGRMEPI